MHLLTQYLRTTKAELIQSMVLVAFTLFSLYLSISMFRLSKMKSEDLTAVTKEVKAVEFHLSKGKQARPEIWIDLGLHEKFRVSYGNADMLHHLAGKINQGDLVTLYVKNAANGFIYLGKENDVLQINKNNSVVYSLSIPQKSFHDNFLLSAVMCFVMPLGFMFYWAKSKSNMMIEAINNTRIQRPQVSAE